MTSHRRRESYNATRHQFSTACPIPPVLATYAWIFSSSFLSESFYRQLRVEPEDILGQPLATIVHPRDRHALRAAVRGVVNARHEGTSDTASTVGGGDATGLGGSLVYVRVTNHGQSCEASMTIVIGSLGLVVVTRLYGS